MTSTYSFNWSVVLDRWPELLAGAKLDVIVAMVGFLLACALGFALALLTASRVRVLTVPSFWYTQLARGVPPYVLLLWLYFGAPQIMGITPDAIQATIAMIAISGSGYTSEVFRSGAKAVEPGQLEAAQSLGLSRWFIFWDIILPQAVRVVTPPLGNIFVGHLKAATVMSVIAARDMVYVAEDVNYTYFRPFEGYTAVAGILIALVFAFSAMVKLLEHRLELP